MSMSDLQAELRAMHDRLGQILAMMEGRGAPVAPRQPTASAAGGYFDRANRAHRIAAEEIFDRLNISEKRRAYFYNRLLQNIRIGELAATIEAEDAEFHRMFPQAARGGGGRGSGRR